MKSILFLAILLSTIAFGQTTTPFDESHVKPYFEEARRLSEKESGKLWGRKLYGPLLFLDYQNRAVIANQQDAMGVLRRNGDVFAGKLPEEIAPANTDIEWSGTHWTMMIWQTIPEDRLTRQTMFAHEMYHRIQNALKLRTSDKLNLHLDSLEGRLWLQLEWRALAAALIKEGPEHNQAVKDALAFRGHRQKLFPEAAENERSLEIAEGIPEYTGLFAAAPDAASARWSAAAKLTNPDLKMSFVRSFAYTSGPAYGLLLDKRLPGWRTKLTAQSDLGKLLASTVKGPAAPAVARSSVYGGAAVRTAENDRADRLAAVMARYRKQLIDGPTLTLPSSQEMRFTFNPSTVVSLDDAGAVYPTFHVVGPWGTLEVTDGALRPKDLSGVIVAAPTKTAGSLVEGQGWKLELSKGWRIVSSAESKNFTVQKN